MARKLVPVEFGKFLTALVFAQIMFILADSGLGQLAAKNIAQSQFEWNEWAENIFSWRIWMNIFVLLAAPLLSFLFFPAREVAVLSIVLTLAMLSLGTADFFIWVLKGFRKVILSSVLLIVSRGTLFFLILGALAVHSKIKVLSFIFLFNGIVSVALAGLVVARSVKLPRFVNLRREFFHDIFPQICRFSIVIIGFVLFNRIDVMIVARIFGTLSAGFYGTAVHILEFLSLIPFSVYGVVLPVFSASGENDEKLKRVFKNVFLSLFLAALLIILVGSFLVTPIVIFILGRDFLPTSEYLRIMLWCCIPIFIAQLFFAFLLARNDFKILIWGVGTGLFVEVLFNVILLPSQGVYGAAWAKLLGTFSVLFVYSRAIGSYQLLSFKKNLAFGFAPKLGRPMC